MKLSFKAYKQNTKDLLHVKLILWTIKKKKIQQKGYVSSLVSNFSITKLVLL